MLPKMKYSEQTIKQFMSTYTKCQSDIRSQAEDILFEIPMPNENHRAYQT